MSAPNPRSTPSRPPAYGTGGFALIATLFLLAAVTLLAVGLLSTATTEVRVSRAYADLYRADLAVQSGFEAAATQLLGATSSDGFLVVRGRHGGAELENLYAANWNGEGWRYTALFSGEGAEAPGSAVIRSPQVAPAGDTVRGVGHPWQDPPDVGWVEVWDDPDKPRNGFRFHYWIEDLEGYLDAASMGNADGPDGKHIRNPAWAPAPGINPDFWGSPDRVALHTAFAETPGDEHRFAQAIFDGFDRAPTAATLKQFLDKAAHEAVDRHLVSGLLTYDEVPVVPYGMGYLGEGQRRVNLNDWIVRKDVNTIVAAIQDQLGDGFAEKRNPAFRGDYLKTLAAGIIDYADEDSIPMRGPGYRGVDSAPFVSELYYRYRWMGPFRKVDGRRWTRLQITPYAELWNMSDKPVSGEFTLRFSDFSPVTFEIRPPGPGRFATPITFNLSDPAGTVNDDYGTKFQIRGRRPEPTRVRLEPNTFKVVAFTPVVIEVNAVPWRFKFEQPARLGRQTGGARYVLRMNRNWIDGTLGDGGSPPRHLERRERLLYWDREGNQKVVFAANIPGHLYRTAGENPGGDALVRNLGDPRGAYFIEGVQVAVDRGGMSPQGRNKLHALDHEPDWIDDEIFVSRWPDGGHDAPAGAVFGSGSGVRNRNPAAIPTIAAEPEKYVQRISNRGLLFSVTELSHIFDPLQFDPSARGPGDFASYRDIGEGDKPDPRYCGGHTLRIGRPEHPAFDAPGTRASQLLDIFYAAGPGESTTFAWGRINVNTATETTLRGLVEGALNRDEVLGDTVPPQWASARGLSTEVARRIIAARPFASTSQLAHLPTLPDGDGPAFFGNKEAYGFDDDPGSPGFTPVNDAFLEELFARLYNNAGLRSRNFRIFVAGESLHMGRDGVARASGRRARVYQVGIEPVRGDEEEILTQNLVIIHERSF